MLSKITEQCSETVYACSGVPFIFIYCGRRTGNKPVSYVYELCLTSYRPEYATLKEVQHHSSSFNSGTTNLGGGCAVADNYVRADKAGDKGNKEKFQYTRICCMLSVDIVFGFMYNL